MPRLPRSMTRILPPLAIAVAAAMPVMSLSPMVMAQDAGATAPAAPVANPLRADVENFWHYGKVGRYDLAADAANKILAAGTDPVAVLQTFEAVAEDSRDKIDVWMLRWQGVDALRDVTTKLLAKLDEGRRTRRADSGWIDANIKMLAENQLSYAIALERLRDSGELAVPQMLDYLKDPSKSQFHGVIRQAFKDLGQLALNPLTAATEMNDSATLIGVIGSLSQIGYPATVPYLARLAQKSESPEIREVAKNALIKMGAGEAVNTPVGDQFFDLAESFYYGKSAVKPDPRNTDANVWTWDQAKGLQRVKIPPAIFDQVMAERAAKTAMKLDTTKDALSLWLAANYKREVNLGDQKDATIPEGTPSAHFFGVAAGTQYLNAALARSLADNDAPVSLKIVKSLEEIVGRTNLTAGPHGEAITIALDSPDRQVRFEAAFTAAAALPTQPFQGQERVVPLLAEAIHQNGVPGVLLMFPSDKVTAKIDELKGVGYNVVGAGNAEGLIAAAAQMPSVDVVIASDDISPNEVANLFTMINKAPRTARAAKIVISKSMTTSSDPSILYTSATDAAGLKPIIEEARTKAGGLPLNDKIATTYALRAADLLSKLAINGNRILDVSTVQPLLLATLEDNRPEVVKAVAGVLALLNDKTVQTSLIIKASDEKTSDEVKIALFKALATSAKNNGNLLDPDSIALVQKSVGAGSNNDVRSAAAEARGALNLPVEQAKTLILGQ